MKKLKKYCLTGLFFLGFILLFSLILTTFNYFDILHFKLTNTFIFIGMILLLFIIGFEYGKKGPKKRLFRRHKNRSLAYFYPHFY